jgi:4-amino-4-deoxy-L-arabinose transferase-like glycosyltransferase
VLVSSPVLHVFSWAMSEPLYLALWLGSTLTLDRYLAGGDRRVLVASGVLAGTAFLTRYVGAVPVVAALIVLAAGAWRQRIAWKDVLLYLALASAPMIVWLGRNSLVAGNLIERASALHLPEREVIRQGADVVIGWFGAAQSLRSEEAVAAAGSAIMLVFIVLLTMLAWKRSGLRVQSHLLELHLLTTALYVVSLLISITLFIDFRTPLDDRILIPAYLSMGIVLLISLSYLWRLRAVAGTALAVGALLALVVRQTATVGDTAAGLRVDGQGYAAARWQESETGHRLRELSPPLIFTNDTTAVYFVAGLPSTSIPTHGGEAGLISMRRDLARQGAVLAIFGSISDEFMPLEPLTEGLTLVEDLDDGRIYRLVP